MPAGLVSLRYFMFLADSHSYPRLAAHLQQRCAQVAAQHAALSERTGTPGKRLDLRRRLALDYELALVAAESDWLDNTPEWLFERESPEEGAQSDGAASVV